MIIKAFKFLYEERKMKNMKGPHLGMKQLTLFDLKQHFLKKGGHATVNSMATLFGDESATVAVLLKNNAARDVCLLDCG